MHKLLLIRISALLALAVTIAMLAGLISAALFEESESFWGFFKSILTLSVISILFLKITNRFPKKELNTRDGFIVVFLSWLVVIFCSALPFCLSHTASLADSFFEASSGITTTGATIFTDVEKLPKSILLWRSITHWIGGMGIVMLSIALMPLLGIGNMQLFRAEQGGLDKERLTPRITQTVKILWIIYLGFTFISVALYMLCGMNAFDAVNHAMCAISSGGFSTKNTSIGWYRSEIIEWVSTASMFMAGISFALYFRLFTGKIVTVFKNSELKAYVGLIAVSASILTIVNWFTNEYISLNESARHALFQSVSIISTTGYSAGDYGSWHLVCQFTLFLLMFVGGCAGSTAGGFKVMRLVILCKNAINEMRLLLHPRGVFLLRMNGSVVSKTMVSGVTGFLFLYIISVILVAFVATTAGADIITALTTGLATIGNLGVGLGELGPNSYTFYPDYAKSVFGLAMIVGRLEIYTFFMLAMPFFWKS